ncbi:MAG: prepilin-type N-terminal cleavage/methylation domain-containing protein [Methylomonas sp.]
MKKYSGFSLIEIMVAFAIMSIVLTMIIRVFATGQRIVSQTENYNIAVQIAESLMARVGEDINLERSQFDGELENKYYWIINIEPLFIDYNLLIDDQSNASSQLKKVNVQVRWEDENNSARVELNAIKQQIRP